MNHLKHTLANIYLHWINDFLTVEGFARYYDMTPSEAKSLIDMGRDCQEQRAQEYKAAHHEKN